MQRLRSTFKRSRTPTGAEMKSQSSLEVPKQVRSASFDEIQLEAKRQDDAKEMQLQHLEMRTSSGTRTTSSSSSSCSPARSTAESKRLTTLRVPQLQSGQRSKSFDVYERSSLLSMTQQTSSGRSSVWSGSSRRLDRETPIIQVSGCYHCACVEEYKNLYMRTDEDDDDDDDSSRDEDDGSVITAENFVDDEDLAEIILQQAYGDDNDDGTGSGETGSSRRRDGSPEIRVTLTTNYYDRSASEVDTGSSDGSEVRQQDFVTCDRQQRRRSVASPRLSRQEALTSFPADLPAVLGSGGEYDDDPPGHIADADDDESYQKSVSAAHYRTDNKGKLVVRDIFLTVPELKRDRAASVDSCFNNKNGKGSGTGEDCDSLTVPQQSVRSKSVDIVLPTEAQTRYTALLPPNDARSTRGWVHARNIYLFVVEFLFHLSSPEIMIGIIHQLL